MAFLLSRHAVCGDITSARLTTFEQSVGATLPTDYRQFMLDNNGGIPDHCKLMMSFHPDSDGESYFTECECFFPIHDDEWKDTYEGRLTQPLQRVFEILRDDCPKSTDYIPIGRDPGGNLICLAIKGPSHGAVFFYDHKNHELYPVADSFTAFLDHLKILDNDED